MSGSICQILRCGEDFPAGGVLRTLLQNQYRSIPQEGIVLNERMRVLHPLPAERFGRKSMLLLRSDRPATELLSEIEDDTDA